jgi:hypothetical protein
MFTLKDGNPVIEAKALFIPEFKKIWDRDKSKDKARATKELAYVYFMADYLSEYNIYGVEKAVMIGREMMDDQKYKPDVAVQEAIVKYEAMQETYSMRYLKNVRETVDSLMEFYGELSFKKGDDANKYNPKALTTALKDVELIVEKIEKWEKKVRGEDDNMQIRGGGQVGLFEDPQKATWLKNHN